MNYPEALTYIHANTWTKHAPGLARIRTLCARLGNPQKALRFIHVAGTNGKGSTCAMTASILRAAGYRVEALAPVCRMDKNIIEFGECE